MKIQLLVLHRKEEFPGQWAPEIQAVVDEWTLTEDPEGPAWWAAQVERHREDVGADAGAWAIVETELDERLLHQALYPHHAVPAHGMRLVPDPTQDTSREQSSADVVHAAVSYAEQVAKVARLGAALVEAGVAPSLVEAIANGEAPARPVAAGGTVERGRIEHDPEPQPGDGPEYHHDHAAWTERQGRPGGNR